MSDRIYCQHCKMWGLHRTDECPSVNAPSSLAPARGSDATYATKTEIAKCAALTAANFIDKGHWVEAYIELHHAARICWERREEERQQPNAPLEPSQP